MIRNLTTGFISPQYHVIYDTKFETVTGGYEENEAVATHIWETLAQDQRSDVLEEARSEKQPMPKLHKDWLTPEEQGDRDKADFNAEVMRRIHKKELDTDPTISIIPETTPVIDKISEAKEGSDSESERDASPHDHIP